MDREPLAFFETAELAWYAVRVSGSEAIIGNCGMLVGRRTIEDPEIGYEITERSRRNGYAMEAAHAVVNECAASGLNRIWATIRPSNLPSLRIVEAVGFTPAETEDDEKGRLLHFSKTLNREFGSPE
jgi:RimJ/RimL family protein N-acetyltransferase